MIRRFSLLIFVSMVLTPVQVTHGQSREGGGCTVVGVIYRGDGDIPFKAHEARVLSFDRRVKEDWTNDEGVYCVSVPNNLWTFDLAFKADGYWGKPLTVNRGDGPKAPKVTLRKQNSNDPGQLRQLDGL